MEQPVKKARVGTDPAPAICEVNRDNVDALLALLQSAAASCDFVALDTEFSGLDRGDSLRAKHVAERYTAFKCAPTHSLVWALTMTHQGPLWRCSALFSPDCVCSRPWSTSTLCCSLGCRLHDERAADGGRSPSRCPWCKWTASQLRRIRWCFSPRVGCRSGAHRAGGRVTEPRFVSFASLVAQ